MADLDFNTTSGQTIARELLIACLNTGTAEQPTWTPVGKRVEDSSEEMDWSKESSQDILGNVFTTMKKPVITQNFDPMHLEAGDAALKKLWNLGIKEQNAQALQAMDMLIVHKYAGTAGSAVFAERYEACAISITSLGGEGGGNVGMPIEVTYGGTRTTGSAVVGTGGAITFTPDT